MPFLSRLEPDVLEAQDNLLTAKAQQAHAASYGFLDVHWVLGGMVCGSQSAFVDARIHVVQDQSCLALHSSQFHMN